MQSARITDALPTLPAEAYVERGGPPNVKPCCTSIFAAQNPSSSNGERMVLIQFPHTGDFYSIYTTSPGLRGFEGCCLALSQQEVASALATASRGFIQLPCSALSGSYSDSAPAPLPPALLQLHAEIVALPHLMKADSISVAALPIVSQCDGLVLQWEEKSSGETSAAAMKAVDHVQQCLKEKVFAGEREYHFRLASANNAIASCLVPWNLEDQALRRCIEAACDIVGSEHGTLFLRDPKDPRMIYVLSSTLRRSEGEKIVMHRLPVADTIPFDLDSMLGDVISGNRVLTADNPTRHERFNDAMDAWGVACEEGALRQTEGLRNVLLVPLLNSHGLACGALQLMNKCSAVEKGRTASPRVIGADEALGNKSLDSFTQEDIENLNQAVSMLSTHIACSVRESEVEFLSKVWKARFTCAMVPLSQGLLRFLGQYCSEVEWIVKAKEIQVYLCGHAGEDLVGVHPKSVFGTLLPAHRAVITRSRVELIVPCHDNRNQLIGVIRAFDKAENPQQSFTLSDQASLEIAASCLVGRLSADPVETQSVISRAYGAALPSSCRRQSRIYAHIMSSFGMDSADALVYFNAGVEKGRTKQRTRTKSTGKAPRGALGPLKKPPSSQRFFRAAKVVNTINQASRAFRVTGRRGGRKKPSDLTLPPLEGIPMTFHPIPNSKGSRNQHTDRRHAPSLSPESASSSSSSRSREGPVFFPNESEPEVTISGFSSTSSIEHGPASTIHQFLGNLTATKRSVEAAFCKAEETDVVAGLVASHYLRSRGSGLSPDFAKVASQVPTELAQYLDETIASVLKSTRCSVSALGFMWLRNELLHVDPTEKSSEYDIESVTTYYFSPGNSLIMKSVDSSMSKMAKLEAWDFDVWNFALEDSPTAIQYMLTTLGCTSDTSVNRTKLLPFVQEVYKGYTETLPFHNFTHGFHVAQATFKLLQDTAPELQCSPLEKAALLVAALCHDIDHPGVNNSFLVFASHPLALTYNDTAPLENHHCAMAHMLLSRPATALFAHLSRPQQASVRAIITKAILGTDMAGHFEEITWLQRVPKPLPPSPSDMPTPNGNRLKHCLVHAADLSAQTLSWPLAMRWGKQVAEEFRLQSVSETKLQLPITPLMENLDQPNALPTLQIGFCQFVLMPFWSSLADIFPRLQPRVSTLKDNAARYKLLEANSSEAPCRGSSSETSSVTGEMEAGSEEDSYSSYSSNNDESRVELFNSRE